MGVLTYLHLRRPNSWERPTILDSLLASPIAYLTTLLYQLFVFLRGRPFQPPLNKTAIRIVALSDTHDKTVQIPQGDLLVHAGDLTNNGTVDDIQKQLDWLSAQPHEHKVLVCGNHDSWFDPRSRKDVDVNSGRKLDFKEIKWLQNSSTTLKFVSGRTLNIYGAADIPECGPQDNA
jgi:predicted MPP superfamily phosphohydrolase